MRKKCVFVKKICIFKKFCLTLQSILEKGGRFSLVWSARRWSGFLGEWVE